MELLLEIYAGHEGEFLQMRGRLSHRVHIGSYSEPFLMLRHASVSMLLNDSGGDN